MSAKTDWKNKNSKSRYAIKMQSRHAIKHGLAMPIDYPRQQLMALARQLLDCPELKDTREAEYRLHNGAAAILENNEETYGRSILKTMHKYSRGGMASLHGGMVSCDAEIDEVSQSFVAGMNHAANEGGKAEMVEDGDSLAIEEN